MKKYFYLLQIEEGSFEGKAGFIPCMPFHIGADYKSLWIALLVQFRENVSHICFSLQICSQRFCLSGLGKTKDFLFWPQKRRRRKRLKKKTKCKWHQRLKDVKSRIGEREKSWDGGDLAITVLPSDRRTSGCLTDRLLKNNQIFGHLMWRQELGNMFNSIVRQDERRSWPSKAIGWRKLTKKAIQGMNNWTCIFVCVQALIWTLLSDLEIEYNSGQNSIVKLAVDACCIYF